MQIQPTFLKQITAFKNRAFKMTSKNVRDDIY